MSKIFCSIFIILSALFLFSCNSDTSFNGNQAPNVPSNPIPANGATSVSVTPTLSWTATDPDDDVLSYGVFVSTSSSFTTFVYDTDLSEPTDYFSNPLGYSTTYYWIVYAEDGRDTTWGPTWSFTTQAAPATTLYTEGFESSVVPGTNWYAGDSNATNGSDYWGDQSSGSGARVHSGSYSMYCADNSDMSGQLYDNYMNAYAQKVTAVNISGYAHAELSFWIWYNTETNYDYVSFQYWNGTNWVEPSSPSGRFSGSSGGWVQATYTFTGSNLFMRWVFKSDETYAYEGVYVDDIQVIGHTSSVDEDFHVKKQSVNVIQDFGVEPPMLFNSYNRNTKRE